MPHKTFFDGAVTIRSIPRMEETMDGAIDEEFSPVEPPPLSEKAKSLIASRDAEYKYWDQRLSA